MDAVQVERLFAGALGIEMGKRGDVNDADYVRSGDPKYLVAALDKALIRLKKRVEHLEGSGDMKMWIEHSIDDLQVVRSSLSKKAGEISHFACFHLWCLSVVALNLIVANLREYGC